MKEVTIRRYHADMGGRWIELWLDGNEYNDDETIWNDEEGKLVKTGDKAWNFSCKLGNFIQDYHDQTGDTISFGYNFQKIIGMKVYLGKRTDQIEGIPEDKIYFKDHY